MRILAIETSCDETGIAVVAAKKEDERYIFAVEKHVLLSQAKLHEEFGGVYPTLAKREHEKNLPLLFEEFKEEKVDAIAVTQGPGLEPALWTGIEFARIVSAERGVPLLPVNHMEGHLISSLIRHSNILQNVGMSGELSDIKMPALALLVSGGHTEFILMKDWFVYERIGETLDDAVGEAFDKVARMLNLPYPGGPHISKHAELAREKNSFSKTKLPRPMLTTNNCDVSFSGLKTAALYALRDAGGIQKLSAEEISTFAREFEDAVTEVLLAKTKRALEQTDAQTFVLGGGVAANKHIRETLEAEIKKEFPEVAFRLPELAITGDNAIMIAEAALMHLITGDWKLEQGDEFRAVGNLSIAS